MARLQRPRITPIAGPILGEFLVGISVAMAGLWMASRISDATAGAFGMSQQVLESLFVLFRVLAIGVGVTITQALGGAAPKPRGARPWLASGPAPGSAPWRHCGCCWAAAGRWSC